ncbi:MAG: hypothetical protein CFH05_00517 [Alphaproteobacteria bacterium MarineAlpha3_Bin4]|nr:MAG: hypothetical protein CFH05_00517 [Alphaproteobacteria bacterium MarineAlpha3_Bin4]
MIRIYVFAATTITNVCCLPSPSPAQLPDTGSEIEEVAEGYSSNLKS